MVSYFKTQWVNLLGGLVNLGISIYYYSTGDELWGIGWALAAVVWFLQSFINYNEERIKMLEAKTKKYDALVKEVSALYDLINAEKRYSELLDQQVRMLAEEIQKRR